MTCDKLIRQHHNAVVRRVKKLRDSMPLLRHVEDSYVRVYRMACDEVLAALAAMKNKK